VSMDEPRERRCEYEGAYFPNDQFEVDTDWGLVHKVEPVTRLEVQ
jgi:hypothetical protein